MSQAKSLDIDTLTGRELDAAVMVEIMGWTQTDLEQDPHELPAPFPFWKMPEGGPVLYIEGAKKFSSDANHVREVEAEIERRGCTYMYIYWLKRDVSEMYDHDDMDNGDWFKIVNATPEQRCRAALRAVMG